MMFMLWNPRTVTLSDDVHDMESLYADGWRLIIAHDMTQARPHWGKNHERQFRHPNCHVRDNFPDWNIAQMMALQERHDPDKVLEPALFGHVVRRTGPEYSALCALQQWCYCDADAHCARGHWCVASPVFPQFKICKLRIRDPAPVQQTQLHDEF